MGRRLIAGAGRCVVRVLVAAMALIVAIEASIVAVALTFLYVAALVTLLEASPSRPDPHGVPSGKPVVRSEDATVHFERIVQAGGASYAVAAAGGDGSVLILGQGPRVLTIDAEHAAAPRVLARTEPLPGVVVDLAVDGETVVVALDSGGVGGSSGAVAVVSVADPTRPRVLGVLDTDLSLRRIALVGDVVVASGNGGSRTGFGRGPYEALIVLDVRDPSRIAELARLDFHEPGVVADAKQPAELGVVGDVAFLVRHTFEPEWTTLHAVDLGDPAAPRVVRELQCPDWVNGAAAVGDLLLVATGPRWADGRPSRLRIFAAADVGSMRQIGSVDIAGVAYCAAGWRIAPVGGNRVVVVDRCSPAAYVVDVSDARRPVLDATWPMTYSAAGVAGAGEHVFIAAGEHGGLRSYVLGDAGTGPEVGSLELIGAVRGVAVVDGATYLVHPSTGVMAVRRDRLGEAAPSVDRLDVYDSRSIVAVGDRLVIGAGSPGRVEVLRPPVGSDPPDRVRLDVGGAAEALAASGTRVFVAAGEGGIHAVDPVAGQLASSNPSVEARSLAVHGERVFTLGSDVTVLDADLVVRHSAAFGAGRVTSALAADDAKLYLAAEGFDPLSGFASLLLETDASAPNTAAARRHDLGPITSGAPRALRFVDGSLLVGGRSAVALIAPSLSGELSVLARWPLPAETWDVVTLPDDGSGDDRVLVANDAGGMVELLVADGPAPSATPSATASLAQTPTSTPGPTLAPTLVASARALLPIAARRGEIGRGDPRLSLSALVGGPGLDLAVVGDTVYRTEGVQLVALDGSAPEAVRELGRSEALPELLRSVDVSGNRAVAACGRSGLAVFDVADPAAPRLVTRVPVAGEAFDAAVLSDHAYVGTDRGVLVVALRGDGAALPVGHVPIDGGVEIVAIHDGVLYAVDGSGEGPVRIFDVTAPDAPVEVGELPASDPIHHLAFEDTRAFVADDFYVQMFDVSDPRSPRRLGAFAYDEMPVDAAPPIAADGTYLFACSQNGTVDVWHVGDPAAAEPAATIPLVGPDGRAARSGCTALHVEASTMWALGGSTFTGWRRPYLLGSAQLVRVNVADPRRAHVDLVESGPYGMTQVQRDGRRLYAVDTRDSFGPGPVDLHRYDLLAPGRLRARGSVTLSGPVVDLVVRGGVAYVLQSAEPQSALVTIDLEDWPAVREVGRVPLPGQAALLAMADGRAYVLMHPAAGAPGALATIDLEDGLAPRVAGQGTVPVGRCSAMAANGTRLWLLDIEASRLVEVDAAIPALPAVVHSVQVHGGRDLAVSDDLAFVLGGYPPSLVAFELSPDGAPRRRGALDIDVPYDGSGAPSILADGDLVFVAWKHLTAVDAADPMDLRQVGMLSPLDYAFSEWNLVGYVTGAAAEGFLYLGVGGSDVGDPVSSHGIAVVRLE